jgi:hypothetical protein
VASVAKVLLKMAATNFILTCGVMLLCESILVTLYILDEMDIHIKVTSVAIAVLVVLSIAVTVFT